MKKYSDLTQHLANIYPPWSVVRRDEQSLGHRILNSMSLTFEKAAKELRRATSNFHLPTSNIDEIDWTYRVKLGNTFEFELDNTDPFIPVNVVPTVSGIIDSTWYNVSIADDNDLLSFWYQHVPDRISVSSTASGVFDLLSEETYDAPFSGVLTPHTPGHLFVETSGGTRYLEITTEYVHRAEVVLHGTTRKGTEEYESLVFAWDQKQRTQKEWSEITKVECLGMPSGVQLTITSADVYPPYMDFWNLRHSEERRKMDFFWELGVTEYGTTLDLARYSTEELVQLLDGIYTIYAERRWELQDQSGLNIEAIDIAQQPFSDNIWAVTDNRLYCYQSDMTTVENVSALEGRTPGTKLQIDLNIEHAVRGETVDVDFLDKNSLAPAVKYRTWVTYPDSTVSGISGGDLVTYDSDAWIKAEDIREVIDDRYSFEPEQVGEYVFAFEAVLTDGNTHLQKRVLCVDSKAPLAEFDLPDTVSGVVGLDFNSDQEMWVYTSGIHHQIATHHDVMLIDYENKEIFFREPYSGVLVWSS